MIVTTSRDGATLQRMNDMLRGKPTLRSSIVQFLPIFGIFMIGLLWLGITHNLRVRQETARQSATKHITTLSRIFEEHVARAVHEADKTLLLLRAAYENEPAKFDLVDWVGARQFKSELAVQYALIGPDGIMIASNVGPANSRVDLSDREHFKIHVGAREDKLFISKPVLGRASGKWSIQLSRMLRNSTGEFAGVLVSSIDPSYLARLYNSIDLGTDGAIMLIGFDGVIRAHGGEKLDVLGKSIIGSEIFRLFVKEPIGVIEGTGAVDGVERLVSYRVVDGFPLIVTAAMSKGEIYSDYRKENKYYYLGGSVISLLIVIFVIGGILSKYRLDTTLYALAKERDNAEHANRAKSSFLAVMSHEIRTPMNAVLGLATTLLEGPLTEEQRKSLQTIHESGDNLLEILNDILDYSKLEAGDLTFEDISFTPSEIVESTIDIIGQRATAHGLTLNVIYDPDLPAALRGDVGRLRQVLLNLVSNAVKFTPSGGVTVSCRCVSKDEKQAIVEWAIVDTGIGIAPERLDRLFNDFVQADCSINRRFGGSGLGLSICKRIISAMGGQIGVESTLGKGTTMRFSVTLPISECAPSTLRSDDASQAPLRQYLATLGRPLRVLIVDDNPTNRLVASKMLQEFGVQVSMAADGVEAVASSVKFNFDIILMDVRMPEMDGLAATRAIRGRGNTVPIVAFTANAFAEDVDDCRAAGMSEFVAKPVRKPLLLAAMLRALRGSPGLTANIETLDRSQRPVVPKSTAPELSLLEYNGLAAEIGLAEMQEVVAAFQSETSERLKSMRSSSLATNRTRIGRDAHTIKGTAGMFGFVRLSELSGWLEQNIDLVDESAYREALDAMDDAYANGTAKAEIRSAA
jgi:signal transduction histidine kinase/CheY-like chemotaxis protein/HPt (histidine-containing phosphotransfer) domain-containing protein